MKTLREKNTPLLLVDSGAILPRAGRDRKLKADVSFQAMSIMGYDAVNLGASDFSFGSKYLEDMASRFSIPFVSSNLVSETVEPPWFKKYIIKEVAGLKVGIIGLMSPVFFKSLPNQQEIKGLRALPPDTVLEKTVHQLREKVDAVLLLSQLSPKETDALIHEFSGIDMAVVASKSCEDFNSSGQDQGPILLCATPKGEKLGAALVRQSQDRRLNLSTKEPIELGDSVLMDPEINDLLTHAYRERKKAADTKKDEAMRQKLMKGLKMSPEQFIQKMKKGESQ